MRLFSFGQKTTKKTSFNQNIRKLTIAIPAFAIIIALPILFLYNSYTYQKEIERLTDKIVRESKEDVTTRVHSICQQIESQQHLLDSVLKAAMLEQSAEILWINKLFQERSINKGSSFIETSQKVLKTRRQNRNDIHIAIFDTLGTLYAPDEDSTFEEDFFVNFSGLVLYYKNNENSLIPTPNDQNYHIENFTLLKVPNTPYIVVSGISRDRKKLISQDMFHKNILWPLFQNSKDQSFLIETGGSLFLSNDSSLTKDKISKILSIKDAKRTPKGTFFEEQSTSSRYPLSITYTNYLKEFDWLIGTTINLSYMKELLKEKGQRMMWQMLNQFLMMSSVLLLMSLLSMWYGKRISYFITNQFSYFMKSFYGLVKNRRPIHSGSYAFEEFDDIITTVNCLTHELQSSEKRFREMADLLPVMLFECDHTGSLTYINSTITNIFQYNIEEIMGRKTYEFFTPESSENIKRNIRERIEGTADIKPRYYRAIKKDGTTFDVMIHASNILNKGVFSGIRGVLTDVSDQVNNEKRLKDMFEESETLNKLMIKREKRVLEMKFEVNSLLKELGKPVKYMATENIYMEENERAE